MSFPGPWVRVLAGVALAVLALGCRSTDARPSKGEAVPGDRSPNGSTDYSKVNPLAGAATVTKIASGFSFTEGTTWNASGGYLVFSDIPGDAIHKLVPPSTVTELRRPSGNANGLAWDPMGRMIACEHGNRRVSRTLGDGTVVTLADTFDGKKLNSPNDSVVRRDGTIYFTDPDYGLADRPRGVAFKGVYRIDPSGKLSVLERGMNQPNGVALSPDERVLYVSDSAASLVNRWTVSADGSVTGKTKLTDTGGGGDGMAMDDGGNLYVTTEDGVKVYKPDGTSWGTIVLPEDPTNCAFGDADRRTLYISAGTSIYKVRLGIPGKP